MSALTNEQLLPHILADEVIERLDRIIVLLEWFAEQQIGNPVAQYQPNPFNSYNPRQRWQPIDLTQYSTESDPSQD